MLIAQIGIALCGGTAVWLSQDPRPQWRRWSPVLGLLGQPFWLIETIAAGQWPITALCALYTWSWWRGFRVLWLGKGAAT